jgi:hypothetical protein
MARSTRKTRKAQKKGKVLSVRSPAAVKSFEKLIKQGPLTFVYVNAKWCGACHQFSDKVWNPLTQLKNKSMNMASVDSEMIGKTSLANVPRKFFPTLLLVGKDGKAATFKDENGQATNAMPRNNTLSEDKEAFSKLVQAEEPVVNRSNTKVVTSQLNAMNTPPRNVNTPNAEIESLGKSPFDLNKNSINDNPSMLNEKLTASAPKNAMVPDVAADLVASQTKSPTGTAAVVSSQKRGGMSGGKMLRAIRNKTTSLKAMLRLSKRSTRKSRR